MSLTRRQLLEKTALAGGALALPRAFAHGAETEGVEVNDVQSQLNPTRVHRVVTPQSLDALHAALRDARREGRAVSIAGSTRESQHEMISVRGFCPCRSRENRLDSPSM